MKFITTRELSKLWGVSQRRIVRLAIDGRIYGAKLYGKSWMFPADSKKPIDGRTKTAREESEKDGDFFRYPIFEHSDISSFHPALSDEEFIIKKAAEEFYACRFEECDKVLGTLPENAKNKYCRIYALRIGASVDIFLCNTRRFFERYSRLDSELQSDFPHKKEMEECIHELDATLGENEYYKYKFNILPDYPYHDSFLPHLTSLNAVSLSFAEKEISLKEISAQEINCKYLERENALVDLQSFHIYLGCAYIPLNMQNEMIYHFKEAFKIAEKYDLFYAPALQYFYMRKPMLQALKDFSKEFQNKLTKCSDHIHNAYIAFTEKASMNTIYRLLPHNEYFYLYSAVQGHTNKELANILRVSEGTVGKRYGEIYATLGVKNKQEMIEFYNKVSKEKIISKT